MVDSLETSFPQYFDRIASGPASCSAPKASEANVYGDPNDVLTTTKTADQVVDRKQIYRCVLDM
jgi:hypothetical protein